MINNISTASILKWSLLGLAATVSGVMPPDKGPLEVCQDPIQFDACGKISHHYLPRKEHQLLETLKPSFFQRILGTAEDIFTYLKFGEDGRPKLLYLVGEYDYNGALHPSRFKQVLKKIHDIYDIQYEGVKSKGDVCYAVKEASKTGVLQNVVISAHGDVDGMCLSDCTKKKGWMYISDDYEDCFKGLDIHGRISLLGGSAGRSTKEGISFAQKMANDAKREVVAATGTLYPDGISLSDTPELEFHYKDPESGRSSVPEQIFKRFIPKYKECSTPKPSMHPREKKAVEEVRSATISSSKLDPPEIFEEYVTKLCKDNPKKKFLFLVVEHDGNGAAEPELMKHILEPIARHYDLKYQVFSSYSELSTAVKEASSMGEVVNVVIAGHGFPLGTQINNSKDKNENALNSHQDLSCFDHLPSSTPITLISCCTGAPEENEDANDNEAHRIAKKTGRKVVAPNQNTHSERLEIKLIEPFEIFEGSLIPKNEPKKNMFHTFNPERTDTATEKSYKESKCYKYKKYLKG